MMVGTVIGNVWATRKKAELSGLKLLVIKPVQLREDASPALPFIAADAVGAGIGEQVLVTGGSCARMALGGAQIPVDAAVIAILDGYELP